MTSVIALHRRFRPAAHRNAHDRRGAAPFVATLAAAALLVSFAAPVLARTLSFEERVAAQRAIEQVYWSHRIWPEQNPGAKPELSTVMPDAAIRAKVEGYLEKSRALEAVWSDPIGPAMLQSEMDRMAAQSRRPEVLEELFAALGNDPYLIAETLVRQALADRLIHDRFTRDPRFADIARRDPSAAFDAWWSKQRAGFSSGSLSMDASYALPAIATSGCTTDTWGTPPTTTNAPADRYAHSAVWTGAEMIVWGGAEIGTSFNTGGRYDPATDTWGAVTSTTGNVPSVRDHHTAVWTGTEMIVWGGSSYGGSLLDTGGRYNPATDTWDAPTSVSFGTPLARYGHTAVWTGTEMIVWGGYSGGGWLNSGGRYNPSTDTWGAATAISASTPAARVGHVAVWTGSNMVIWGGVNNNGVLDTGGRYDPATNSWGAATASSGVVMGGRENATAVWTGTQMIVWGGSSGNSYQNTGGRYDPATDTWTAGPSTNGSVPTGRGSHSAIWTGTEMIVWGGSDNINYSLANGGRWCGAGTTAVDGVAPVGFQVGRPWPDPAPANTSIEFRIPSSGVVRAQVLDVAGRRVTRLLDRTLDAGTHRLDWNGRDGSGRAVAPGVYLIQVSLGAQVQSRRIVLVD